MTKWQQYAELDDIQAGDAEMMVAYTNQDLLFLGGVNDSGHMVVVVTDKPDDIQTNKDLSQNLDSHRISELMATSIGQITLGKPCKFDAVIERIIDELQEGFGINYAMRISALAQYPEFQDLQKAHEVAVNIPETGRVLKAKHPANVVTQTTAQTPIIEHDLSF